MIVNGHAEISLSLNIYDLETDAVYIDSYGYVRISDADKFISDWCDHWVNGIGELSGASTLSEDLEIEQEDEDDAERREECVN